MLYKPVYTLYILYSKSLNKHYVGYTNDNHHCKQDVKMVLFILYAQLCMISTVTS
jgi:hypothetical protein